MFQQKIQDAVVNNTNNTLESYKRTMKQLMGVKPNHWHFINSISNQEAETRWLLLSNATGPGPHSQPGQEVRARGQALSGPLSHQ